MSSVRQTGFDGRGMLSEEPLSLWAFGRVAVSAAERAHFVNRKLGGKALPVPESMPSEREVF